MIGVRGPQDATEYQDPATIPGGRSRSPTLTPGPDWRGRPQRITDLPDRPGVADHVLWVPLCARHTSMGR